MEWKTNFNSNVLRRGVVVCIRNSALAVCWERDRVGMGRKGTVRFSLSLSLVCSVGCFFHPELLLSEYCAILRIILVLPVVASPVLQKGQVESGCYRFLCKHGGHVWLLTQATLLCDSAQRPECVVCLNYVLSKVEHEGIIVSEHQQPPAVVQEQRVSNTCAIFKRRSRDMNKQFLNFPDADILLFHSDPLKSKLDLDLFPDDGIEDPFSYREDSLSSPSYCGTPPDMHLPLSTGTSPDRFSPGTPDSGSLSDIPSLDPSFSNLTFTRKEDYEEDLDFRAPFIPMQMDDDFPLISPSNSVMWGPPQETPLAPAPRKTPADRTSDADTQTRQHPSKQQQAPSNENCGSLQSSLAALLQSDTTKKASNNARHNDRNNKRWQNEQNKATARQRNFANSRSSSGHIIMLDSVPSKKPVPPKSAPSQQRRATPSIGSHTSTVRVNDRLIKVQVSVSELPSAQPIEQKQPFPSPPDPPPKRASPASSTAESPKRIKVHNGHSASQGSITTSDSVLLNLLISGEDASRGYLCSGSSRYAENKQQFEPAVLSLPANDRLDLGSADDLLNSEGDLLDSYLKIQYESALHSDELLDALDHPLLRNVSAALG
ncbi:hypothetical protein JTE90_017379 [Oedothorax gibbosus]|uniref:Hypoxia-inducible factor 1 alpha n=1 Tax=Oedothorax gibbosus TaxID=931172 RepID=A0AAV6VPJ8_9ARAC|nr:hypothetical protein JTE90_017379 [Oedothorax gibbosus]